MDPLSGSVLAYSFIECTLPIPAEPVDELVEGSGARNPGQTETCHVFASWWALEKQS